MSPPWQIVTVIALLLAAAFEGATALLYSLVKTNSNLGLLLVFGIIIRLIIAYALFNQKNDGRVLGRLFLVLTGLLHLAVAIGAIVWIVDDFSKFRLLSVVVFEATLVAIGSILSGLFLSMEASKTWCCAER